MPERDSISSRLAWLAAHGEQGYTGRVTVEDAGPERRAHLFLRNGLLYAVHVTGFRAPLAARLHTAGVLSERQRDALLQAVGGDPRDPALGDHIARHGLAPAEVVAAVHREVLLSALAAISTWTKPRTHTADQMTTTASVVAPITVTAALAALTRRAQHWDTIWAAMTGGAPAPEHRVPNRTDTPPVVADLTPDGRALLTLVDGVATVDEIAGHLGMTRFETGHLLHALHTATLVSFTPTGFTGPDPAPEPPVALAPSVAPPTAPAPPIAADPHPTPDGKPHTFTMDPASAAQIDEAHNNVARLRAVLSDVAMTVASARRSREAAEVEEAAARDAALHAQAVHQQAATRSALARRLESECAERAAAAQRDLDRAETALDGIDRAPTARVMPITLT